MIRSNITAAKAKIYRKKGCLFCKEKITPSYKEIEILKKFITERGKIVPRAKSGVCAAHQRELAKAVKRARLIALLPFVPRVQI